MERLHVLTIVVVVVLISCFIQSLSKNPLLPSFDLSELDSKMDIKLIKKKSTGYLNYLQLIDSSATIFPENYRSVEFYLTQDDF